jgi:hypothetical protein
MFPFPSSVKPAGSVPDFNVHLKGELPPCTKLPRANEKFCPTFPSIGPGGGLTSVGVRFTVTQTVANLDGSAADTARISIVSGAWLGLMLLGAMYVLATPLAVAAFAIAPHTVSPDKHLELQLTPLLLGSPLTLAVTESD